MVTPLNTAATAILAAIILRAKRFQEDTDKEMLQTMEGRGGDTGKKKRKPSFLSDVAVMKGVQGD